MLLPLALTVFLNAAPIRSGVPSASLKSFLTAKPADSRGFTLYRWDRFPSILVLDTADFQIQDSMFSRLAHFLEKKGFRGRLLDNTALKQMHGWNAHDYGAAGLSAFFNAVQREGIILNPEEISLRDLALGEGVLSTVHDRYEPGVGGVISISQSSSLIERRLLLTHESFHGIFFASADYRLFCFKLWDSLSPQTRSFFWVFLDELGYDASYRYLAVNEFQAYLMQQPLRYAPAYFERVTERFAQRDRPPGEAILRAARRLDDFLETHYGIRAGETLSAP